ncbi:MAG: hypothetical protein JSS66_05070 [Armatimonadetes bacterium]|nr:hypothetical protein [Armatimonadota bacterium]
MATNIYVGESWLREQYVVKARSLKEIAIDLGCSEALVTSALRRFDIPLRTNNGNDKLTKEWLQAQYAAQKTIETIALEANCSTATVSRKLRELGIVVRRPRHESAFDIIGLRFGQLTVLEKKTGKVVCACACGRKVRCTPGSLTSGSIQSCSKCAWSGIGQADTALVMVISKARSAALKRGLQFAVGNEFLTELYNAQGRMCALSGVRLNVASNAQEHKSGLTTASLDRVDSNLGYVEGNVQWVHKDVNCMKWNLRQHEFIQWCHAIANHMPIQPIGAQTEVALTESDDNADASEWDSDLWRQVTKNAASRPI